MQRPLSTGMFACGAGSSFVLDTIRHFYTSPDARNSIRNMLFSLRTQTRFECVGIRLKSGEDYPYYETLGFPEVFVEKERYLCADNGKRAERGRDGKASLECICGNVISGRTDPSLPFFTRYGSFWTNSTTDLLANASMEELDHARNRCHAAGYESVGLVPIFGGGARIGLLQFNDRRRDMFDRIVIERIEHLSFVVGIYLGSIASGNHSVDWK